MLRVNAVAACRRLAVAIDHESEDVRSPIGAHLERVCAGLGNEEADGYRAAERMRIRGGERWKDDGTASTCEGRGDRARQPTCPDGRRNGRREGQASAGRREGRGGG